MRIVHDSVSHLKSREDTHNSHVPLPRAPNPTVVKRERIQLSTSANAASQMVRSGMGAKQGGGTADEVTAAATAMSEEERLQERRRLRAAAMTDEQSRAYVGVTEDFLAFVDGLTIKSFKEFPIDSELPPLPEQIDQVDGTGAVGTHVAKMALSSATVAFHFCLSER